MFNNLHLCLIDFLFELWQLKPPIDICKVSALSLVESFSIDIDSVYMIFFMFINMSSLLYLSLCLYIDLLTTFLCSL